jgi:hydrogenase maturation factor HypE
MVEMDKKDRENRWVRTIKNNFDESDYTPVRLVLDADRRLSFSEYEKDCDEEPAQANKTERVIQIIGKRSMIRV